MGDIALFLGGKSVPTSETSFGILYGNKAVTLDDIRKMCYSTGLVKLEGLSQWKIRRKLLQNKTLRDLLVSIC